MRRSALVLALLTVALSLLTACAGEDSAETELTLVAHNSSVGRATFTLFCEPSGGDVPDPAAACSALSANPGLIRDFALLGCFGGTWWDVEFTGHFRGKAVDVATSGCWTPQLELVRALGIGSTDLYLRIDPLFRPADLGNGIPRSALVDPLSSPPGMLQAG